MTLISGQIEDVKLQIYTWLRIFSQINFKAEEYEGRPPKMEFINKIFCTYSYMFKLQSLSKYSPFDAIHLWRHFFPLLKNRFWTHQFWCILVFLLFFVSALPHQQNIPLWGPFSSGETNKGHLGLRSGEEGGWRVEHGGHAIFGQKLLNTVWCEWVYS